MTLFQISLTTLILSAALVLGGAAVCLARFVNYLIATKKNTKTAYKGGLSGSIQLFTAVFFCGVVIALFPVNYQIVNEAGFWAVLKTVLVSAQNALQVFTVNAGFESVQEVMGGVSPEWYSRFYTVYVSVLFVIAPAITATFILSFFKETFSRLRYKIHFRSDIYIMSALTEKSLEFAQNIKADGVKNDGGKYRLVVFANVNKKSDDPDDEKLYIRAKRAGAVCFGRETELINLKPRSKRKRYIYFISENQDQNISDAMSFIKKYSTSQRINNGNTHIYVFGSGPESSALVSTAVQTVCGNAENKDKFLSIRLIDEYRNFAWQTLREENIFNDPQNGQKDFAIAVVGFGKYGLEFVKALSWLSNMPGYKIKLHVFDGAADCQNNLINVAPELIEFLDKAENEATYLIKDTQNTITFHSQMDVKSKEFGEKISKIKNLSSVFVVLGVDALNIETAINIRVKISQNGENYATKIYPLVYSRARSEMCAYGENLQVSVGNKFIPYNLNFIGNISKRYTLEGITNRSLENDGLKFHYHWALSPMYQRRHDGKDWTAADEQKWQEEKAVAELKYEKSDYNRTSSMAQALYYKFFIKIYPESMYDAEGGEELSRCEHIRWCNFMRSQGYVYGEKRNDLAKQHNDLVAFDKLSPEDRNKDAIWAEAYGKVDYDEEVVIKK